MQRPKSDGGLALPNFRFYYWAANFRIVQYWLQCREISSPPVWLKMEAASSIPASLSSLAHASILNPYSSFTKNVCVKLTLKIWNQFRRHFGFQTISFAAPVASNPAFSPSIIDNAFSTWANLGIRRFQDLYIDNTFATFEQLSVKFGLPRSHFFRFLQIRSYVRSLDPRFPTLPGETQFDIFLTPLPTLKGSLSIIYRQLCSLQSTSLSNIKSSWEEELGEEISDDVWENALKKVHTSSICARHALIQCKIIHRAHWTTMRLSRIYKDVNPNCIRCNQSPANHVHMFWSCPSLIGFWKDIFDTLSEICHTQVEPDPLTALFGVSSPTIQLTNMNKGVIAFVTLLARRLILLRWKSSVPPSHALWIKSILNCIKLEKIRHTLRGSLNKFYTMWAPFFSYVKSLHFPAVPE